MLKSYVYFPEELDKIITKESRKTGSSKASLIRDAVAEKYNAKKSKGLSKLDKKLLSELAGSVNYYEDPFEPAAPPEDWEVVVK